MSNVYRFPVTEAVEAHEAKVGAWMECPACNASLMMNGCKDCGSFYTNALGDKCHPCGSGKHRWGPIPRLKRLHRSCSPASRIRHGFLWLRKCAHPGTHVHQRCDRCGWRGIAMVEAK